MSTIEWGRIAARAQLGEREALEQLLRNLQQPLRAHIASVVRDEELALDVLQTVLFTIYRRLTTLRDPQWVRAWAYRIATRAATRAAVARGQPPMDIDDVAEMAVEAETGDADALRERLRALLQRLPASAQLALRMHYYDELTFREISEALEVPVGTVKSRVAYGLKQLRRLVKA